jgi:hypothetical protein
VNPNHTERKHARLSASRMDRVMACPGSVRLESQMPQEPAGPAAERGTAIHELAEAMLRGDALNPADYDGEHWNMAQEYVSFLNSYFENPRKRLIEVNVDEGLKTIHQALGGTADAILVEGNTMACIDLKTGRVPVSAEDNKQLMTYALGAMLKLKAPEDITVDMVIFQPGVGVSKSTIPGSRLVEHAKELKAAATLALSYGAPTNPSPDACKYCRAKTICPSMRQKVQDNARKEFSEDTTVTPEMLDLASIATAWAEAVQDAAKQQLKQMKPIEGWTLRPGRKTRFWKAESLAMEALKDHPEAFDLKSPSAVEKLGITVSAELIGEKQAAESLVRAKPSA